MSYFTVLLEEPICSTGSLRGGSKIFDSEMGVAIEIDQHGGTSTTGRRRIHRAHAARGNAGGPKTGRVIFLPCPLLADSVEKVDHGFHGREVGVRD